MNWPTLREQEAEHKKHTARLQQDFDERLISLQSYTEQANALDLALLEKRLTAFKQEESAARRAAKNKIDGDRAARAVRLQAQEANDEFERRKEDRDAARRQAERDAERQHQQALVEIVQTGREATARALRDAAGQSRIGVVEAETATIALEREAFDERRRLLAADAEAAFNNLEERRRIADDLAKLTAERAAFEVDASRRIQDAQAQEAAQFRTMIEARVRALRTLRDVQLALREQQAELLQTRADRAPRASSIIFDALRAQADLARERAGLQSADNERAIRSEFDRADAVARSARASKDVLLQIERDKNAALEAERQRHQAALAGIDENQRQQGLLADPSSPLSIFGARAQAAADEGANLFGQLKASATEALDSVSASLGNMQTIFEGAFGSIANGLGAMIENFILTGQTGPAAFKKLAAGVIASLVAQSAVKAIFELAQGLAAAARYDYVAAGKHFAAAKTFGIVAGVGAIAAASIGAASGGGERDGNRPGQQINRDGRTIEQGGDRASIREQLQPQVILIRAEHAPGVVVDIVRQDIRNNGPIRDDIQQVSRTAG
jgi:hypothetical protein